MSIAEDLLEALIDAWIFGEDYYDPPVPGPPYLWHDEYGYEYKLEEMTASHIKNCMKRLNDSQEWYWIFKNELDRRRAVLDSLGMKGTEL